MGLGRGVDRMGSVSWRVGSAEQEHFVLLSKLKAKRLKKHDKAWSVHHGAK